jgi:hypothetical protein
MAGFGDILTDFITRLPWENLIHRNPDRELDDLRAIINENPQLLHKRSAVSPACPNPSPQPALATATLTRDLPTTAETVQELKRRLGAELYRLEMDLVAGGRIAGKACDCLQKHAELGILSIVGELVPMDRSPVNEHIIAWVNSHLPEFQIDVVAATEPARYRQLAPEVRSLRKELLGTEKLVALLNDEQKAKIQQDARALLEKQKQEGG